MSKVLELDFEHDAIRCVPGHLPKNKISDCILLQFTGFFDKHGKEIYEGYILRTYKNFNQTNYIVQWKGDGFMCFEKQGDPTGYALQTLTRIVGGCEVVGNIYENIDMLK